MKRQAPLIKTLRGGSKVKPLPQVGMSRRLNGAWGGCCAAAPGEQLTASESAGQGRWRPAGRRHRRPPPGPLSLGGLCGQPGSRDGQLWARVAGTPQAHGRRVRHQGPIQGAHYQEPAGGRPACQTSERARSLRPCSTSVPAGRPASQAARPWGGSSCVEPRSPARTHAAPTCIRRCRRRHRADHARACGARHPEDDRPPVHRAPEGVDPGRALHLLCHGVRSR